VSEPKAGATEPGQRANSLVLPYSRLTALPFGLVYRDTQLSPAGSAPLLVQVSSGTASSQVPCLARASGDRPYITGAQHYPQWGNWLRTPNRDRTKLELHSPCPLADPPPGPCRSRSGQGLQKHAKSPVSAVAPAERQPSQACLDQTEPEKLTAIHSSPSA
jgi:hypothetical protein